MLAWRLISLDGMATSKTRHFLLRAVLIFVAVVACAELVLRLQQRLGPLYDLQPKVDSLDWYSDVVNHRPPPHTQDIFSGAATYGADDGYTYALDYDELGIRVPYSVATNDRCSGTPTILFMGDSFIEGYDISRTVPHMVARLMLERYGICSRILNSGHSSYSPAVYVPLARQLLARISPDYIVVDIDETDLSDDIHRYEALITRNKNGENIGVRATPVRYALNRWEIAAGSEPLYLQRFIDRLYIRFFIMPKIGVMIGNDFSVSADHAPDARQKHSAELSIFRRNLEELVGVLGKHVAPGRIIFIRHPHQSHLETGADGKPKWNDIIASTVEQVARSHGAIYYDATPELRQQFGADAASYYWSNGDIHFNFKGQKAYSEAVARFLATRLPRP